MVYYKLSDLTTETVWFAERVIGSCSDDVRGVFVPSIPAVKICWPHEVQNSQTDCNYRVCTKLLYLRDKPTHAHIQTNTCTYTNQHMHIYKQIHAHIQTNTCTYTNQHMHIYKPTHAHIQTNTCTYTNVFNQVLLFFRNLFRSFLWPSAYIFLMFCWQCILI